MKAKSCPGVVRIEGEGCGINPIPGDYLQRRARESRFVTGLYIHHCEEVILEHLQRKKFLSLNNSGLYFFLF